METLQPAQEAHEPVAVTRPVPSLSVNGLARSLTLLVWVCLWTLVGPLAANAQTVGVFAQACGHGDGSCVANYGVAGATAISSGTGPYDRRGSAKTEAVPGSLKMEVLAEAQDLGGHISSARASFDDVVQISGRSNTEPIEVTVTAFLHGTFQGTPNNSTFWSQLVIVAGGGGNTLYLANTSPGMYSGTVMVLPGANLELDSFMEIHCRVTFGFCSGDFYDTGRVGLSSSTPGLSFVGATGHDYALALVPEPNSALSLLAGGGLLLALRRRCRHGNS